MADHSDAPALSAPLAAAVALVRPTREQVLDADTSRSVIVGLIGGYGTARATGNRPLGGAVLAAAGLHAGRTWLARRGGATTAALASIYVLGFGLSHPLAKKIGAWPSVLTVTGIAAGAAHVLSDARQPR